MWSPDFKVGIGQDSHRFFESGSCPGGVNQSKDFESSGAVNQPEAVNPSGAANSRRAGNPRGIVLGGVDFFGAPPLIGNSDADVVLHALTNAISGVTGVNILGAVSDRMCLEEGITDSAEYVQEAMKYLGDFKLSHISFSIECKNPIISPKIPQVKEKIAEITGVTVSSVCITATSGEGLTPFGQGLGIQVFCAVTAVTAASSLRA